jgi:tight adherence protein B
LSDLSLVIAAVGLAAVFIGWAALHIMGRVFAMQRERLHQEAQTSLKDMFIFVDPAKLFAYNIVAFFVVPALLWALIGNPVISVAAAVGIMVLPRMAVNRLRKRRLTTFERQLPDALLMISGSLRAGAGLTVAIESMVSESRPPISQEFDLLLREQRVGVDFDSALQNMEKRIPLQDFVMVVAGLRISREVGGNLADILESLADTLRRKHTMEGKINSLTAQGRVQGVVMTGLPIFLMLVLSQMEPEAMAPLFNSLIGWGVLAVIAVMEMVGYFFISKITNIDV